MELLINPPVHYWHHMFVTVIKINLVHWPCEGPFKRGGKKGALWSMEDLCYARRSLAKICTRIVGLTSSPTRFDENRSFFLKNMFWICNLNYPVLNLLQIPHYKFRKSNYQFSIELIFFIRAKIAAKPKFWPQYLVYSTYSQSVTLNTLPIYLFYLLSLK